MTDRPRITVLNESEEFLELVEVLLEREAPYDVTTIRLPETSADEVAATDPELVIVDVSPARERGRQLLRQMLRHPDIRKKPIILTSPAAVAQAPHLTPVHELPNVTRLPKPFTADALERLVRSLLPAAD